MSLENKLNYLTDEWILAAPERLARPHSFKARAVEDIGVKDCPFCSKNSHMIEKYIYTSGDGRVSIVPNRYPAVSENSPNGFGIHDVVIETPNHDERLAFFLQDDIFTYLYAIKLRLIEISQIDKVKYIQVFKNEGQKGGASIYHSHSQILAMSFVPKRQAVINSNFEKFYKSKRLCYLCEELKNLGELMVYENKLFAAYSPYASNYAYGLNIAPKNHISDFRDFDVEHITALAQVFKKILPAYYRLYNNFSYNISFQNAPYNGNGGFNHFYIEIIPRMGQFAGFEMSTGCYINPIDVYLAADTLRGLIE